MIATSSGAACQGSQLDLIFVEDISEADET
jgi:hypothetical protein